LDKGKALVYFSLESQLEDILTLHPNIKSSQSRAKTDENALEDIFDGKVYKSHKKNLEGEDFFNDVI